MEKIIVADTLSHLNATFFIGRECTNDLIRTEEHAEIPAYLAQSSENITQWQSCRQ